MTDSEIWESNFIWIERNKYFAHQSDESEYWESDGLSVIWTYGHNLSFNVISLSHPVRGLEDIEARIKPAIAYARKFDLPWKLFICEDWLPEAIRPQIPEILSKYELYCPFEITGMAADKLLPSVKAIPELECFAVDNLERMRAIIGVLASSFEVPYKEDWYRLLGNRESWGKSLFASVGYVEGKAVSTAVTIAIADRLCLALVGTLSDHRNKGYASATIRHSMAEAERVCGKRRTIVHSQSAAVSTYKKLGYHPVTSFLACTINSPETEVAIE